MARRKKKSFEKKNVQAVDYEFREGPWDGKTRRMVFPPQRHVRVCLPEWATYEYHDDAKEDAGGFYFYIGDVHVMRDISEVYYDDKNITEHKPVRDD